jgi:5-methylcytosine-specific restriction endonuclease McrA
MESDRVLVLNQTFEPLQVCSARRAVVLLFTGKAERIEDSPRVFRSPSTALVVPAVIRLQAFVRRPVPPSVSFNKKNILKRDAFTCQYCGRNGGERMTIDHVVPKSLGGRTVWENVVSCCRACNLRKGNKHPAEAGMSLLRKPGKPRSPLALGHFVHSPAYAASWGKYLPAQVEPSGAASAD